MKCINHLRYLQSPDSKLRKKFAKIEKQAIQSISSSEILDEYISDILYIFHEALKADRNRFIKDILFQNQLILRRTGDNQDYIVKEFNRAKRSKALGDKQRLLVNVYRAVISELFDPYLAVIIACVSLAEGKFQSLLVANLSAAEFNKVQFATSKLKSTRLFRGYFPIMRNSISHAGTDGISYHVEKITFKKVLRNLDPVVADTMTVTTDELTEHIQAVMDFIYAVEVSTNIIGLDIGQIILEDQELAQEFFEVLVTPEQLQKRRKINDSTYNKIWDDRTLTYQQKIEHFTRLFKKGCEKYRMSGHMIQFRDAEEMVVIQVPVEQVQGDPEKTTINRIAELIRYALLAEPFYHFRFKTFLVEEWSDQPLPTLQVWLTAEDLKIHNIGKSNMIDLLHDGKAYRNRNYLELRANFEVFDETELKSLQPTRKRKARK